MVVTINHCHTLPHYIKSWTWVIGTRCGLVFQTDSQVTSLATGLQGDTAWDIWLKLVCCAFTMLKRLKDSHPSWPRLPVVPSQQGTRSAWAGAESADMSGQLHSHVLLNKIERWELIEWWNNMAWFVHFIPKASSFELIFSPQWRSWTPTLRDIWRGWFASCMSRGECRSDRREAPSRMLSNRTNMQRTVSILALIVGDERFEA